MQYSVRKTKPWWITKKLQSKGEDQSGGLNHTFLKKKKKTPREVVNSVVLKQ